MWKKGKDTATGILERKSGKEQGGWWVLVSGKVRWTVSKNCQYSSMLTTPVQWIWQAGGFQELFLGQFQRRKVWQSSRKVMGSRIKEDEQEVSTVDCVSRVPEVSKTETSILSSSWKRVWWHSMSHCCPCRSDWRESIYTASYPTCWETVDKCPHRWAPVTHMET